METSGMRIDSPETDVNSKTCAECTAFRLRFFPHRPKHSPYCKVWNQLIDTDDPACPHFNPDALPPTLRATVETSRALASAAASLPPM